MLFFRGEYFGAVQSYKDKIIASMVFRGAKIWQSISKYWRRTDKWRRDQKW